MRGANAVRELPGRDKRWWPGGWCDYCDAYGADVIPCTLSDPGLKRHTRWLCESCAEGARQVRVVRDGGDA